MIKRLLGRTFRLSLVLVQFVALEALCSAGSATFPGDAPTVLQRARTPQQLVRVPSKPGLQYQPDLLPLLPLSATSHRRLRQDNCSSCGWLPLLQEIEPSADLSSKELTEMLQQGPPTDPASGKTADQELETASYEKEGVPILDCYATAAELGDVAEGFVSFVLHNSTCDTSRFFNLTGSILSPSSYYVNLTAWLAYRWEGSVRAVAFEVTDVAAMADWLKATDILDRVAYITEGQDETYVLTSGVALNSTELIAASTPLDDWSFPEGSNATLLFVADTMDGAYVDWGIKSPCPTKTNPKKMCLLYTLTPMRWSGWPGRPSTYYKARRR